MHITRAGVEASSIAFDLGVLNFFEIYTIETKRLFNLKTSKMSQLIVSASFHGSRTIS